MKYERYEGARGMRSISVEEDEVFMVRLEKGESIYWHFGATPAYTAPANKRAVLIADRVREVQGGYLITSNIRQAVVCDFFDPYDYNGGWIWYPGDQALRKICAQRGAERITVPAEVRPLCPVTKVLVPDFRENGTSYFVVPAKIMRELRPVEFKAYCV